MDEQFRRNLEAEEELDTIFDAQEARHLAQIAEANREKEEANREKDEANRERDEAHREKQQALYKLVRQMKKYGATLPEIAAETGLTYKEVTDCLKFNV
jgi:hypothetical protein